MSDAEELARALWRYAETTANWQDYGSGRRQGVQDALRLVLENYVRLQRARQPKSSKK